MATGTESLISSVMKLLLLFLAAPLVMAHDYSDIDTKFRFESLEHDMKGLERQVDCYLDRGPCDDIPLHYKIHIKETLEDNCDECSPQLKHNILTFLTLLKTKLPADYVLFRNKYDPDGKKFDAMRKLSRHSPMKIMSKQ